LTTLHQGQIQAYRTAATAALTEWAASVVLPEPAAHETREQYVQRCRTAVSRPAWRAEGPGRPEMARLDERARDAYAAHGPQERAATEEGGGGDEEGEVEDGEENVADVTPPPPAVDEEDEGEIDETADATTDTKSETKSTSSSKPPTLPRSNKPAFVKKTVVTKPAKATPAARTGRGGRGGRGSSVRGGRGGGNSRP
jgi:hypothetical protein